MSNITHQTTNQVTSIILKQIEEILYFCQRDNKKLLILDLDDTVFNSTKTLIDILKISFNELSISEDISIDDIKEWNFRSLLLKINHFFEKNNIVAPMIYTKEKLMSYMTTRSFWERVQFQDGFLELYNSSEIKENYYILFLTEGNVINCEHKINKLMELLPNKDFNTRFFFLGLTDNMYKDTLWKYIKQNIRTKEFQKILNTSIIVDDKLSNLCGTGIHILIKNYRETDYNGSIDRDPLYDNTINQELYIVNNLQEVTDILLFINK